MSYLNGRVRTIGKPAQARTYNRASSPVRVRRTSSGYYAMYCTGCEVTVRGRRSMVYRAARRHLDTCVLGLEAAVSRP